MDELLGEYMNELATSLTCFLQPKQANIDLIPENWVYSSLDRNLKDIGRSVMACTEVIIRPTFIIAPQQ